MLGARDWFGELVAAYGEDFGGFRYALDDGVGTGRAAGHEDVDRDVLVQGTVEGAAIDEDVGGRGAGSDGDDRLGATDLAVDGLDGADGVLCHRAGHAEDIGVARAAFEADAELFGIVAGREGGDDFDVAAVATAGVEVEE